MFSEIELQKVSYEKTGFLEIRSNSEPKNFILTSSRDSEEGFGLFGIGFELLIRL
jgi:hypothetical protein